MDELLENARSLLGPFEKARVVPLAGDGSDRKFFRIFCSAGTLVGLISPRRLKAPVTDENDSYLLIGNHLHSKGLPAPRILHADVARGRFLLEDAGDLHLQKFVLSRPSRLESIYNHAIKMLGELHRKAADGFEPRFCFDSPVYDPAFVYERELEYFRKSFVNGCMGLETTPDELRADFEAIAEDAGVSRGSLVFHRDFQSRNIMVHRGGLKLIDFQGMRFGPPVYDLASLLIDPYVKLPFRLQDRLLSAYWSSTGRLFGFSKGDFLKKFAAVRLARNLQILGAYGFLGVTKKKKQFLQYVPFAFEQLALHLAAIGRGRYPRLAKLVGEIGGRAFTIASSRREKIW
ncbi:MAG: phosphotransferase [Syntrophobacteraceae bacterium]|nr:phosphotransferase [Syntrophobacteraceae bacterium]